MQKNPKGLLKKDILLFTLHHMKLLDLEDPSSKLHINKYKILFEHHITNFVKYDII
jgi:hypothetical protein